MRPSMLFGDPAPSMIVVTSLSTVMRLARPRSSSLTLSSLMPVSSMMALPPVRMEMSSSIGLRRSAKARSLHGAGGERAAVAC